MKYIQNGTFITCSFICTHKSSKDVFQPATEKNIRKSFFFFVKSYFIPQDPYSIKKDGEQWSLVKHVFLITDTTSYMAFCINRKLQPRAWNGKPTQEEEQQRHFRLWGKIVSVSHCLSLPHQVWDYSSNSMATTQSKMRTFSMLGLKDEKLRFPAELSAKWAESSFHPWSWSSRILSFTPYSSEPVE